MLRRHLDLLLRSYKRLLIVPCMKTRERVEFCRSIYTAMGEIEITTSCSRFPDTDAVSCMEPFVYIDPCLYNIQKLKP